MKLNESPFERIKNGTKGIEFRLFDEKRQQIKVNDMIEFTKINTNETIKCIVTNLYRYPSFKELYAAFNKERLGYQIKEEAEYFTIGDDDDNEEESVIEINYIEDLVELSQSTKNGNTYKGKTIKLMRDLDFKDPDSYRDGIIGWILVEGGIGNGFEPIGSSINKFMGSFDGQSHTISNLYIKNAAQHNGFFGYIENAEICNLNLKGKIEIAETNSNSEDAYVGGFVGYSNSNTTIDNSTNNGAVTIKISLRPSPIRCSTTASVTSGTC